MIKIKKGKSILNSMEVERRSTLTQGWTYLTRWCEGWCEDRVLAARFIHK